MAVKVKDWSKFQHFKDRKPPWIKLYRDVLDDIQWHELNGEDAKTLVMLWLIASESDGKLPSMKELAFRLRVTEKSIKSTVSRLGHWLIQDDIKTISDINAISPKYQDDPLETETEEERETEEEKISAQAPPRFVLPDWINAKHWDAWHQCAKKKKTTDEQKQITVDKLAKWRAAGDDFETALENAALGGYQGLFLPDGNPKARTKPESFKQSDDREARARWEEMTGRTHPDNLAQARTTHGGMVVDVTPKSLEISQ